MTWLKCICSCFRIFREQTGQAPTPHGSEVYFLQPQEEPQPPQREAREHHATSDRHTSRCTSSDGDDGQMNGEDMYPFHDIDEMGDTLASGTIYQLQQMQERKRLLQKKRLTGAWVKPQPKLPPEPAREVYDLVRKDEPCPRCGCLLVERYGPYGGFLGCSAYPECTYTRGRSRGLTMGRSRGLAKGRSHPKISYTAMERIPRGPKL